jgi:hypothetical protein
MGRCLQQRVPAQGATWPGDEDPKQRKLAAGQRNGASRLADKSAGVEIEDEAAKPHSRLPFPRKRSTRALAKFRTDLHDPPQQCPDSGDYMAITAPTFAIHAPRPASTRTAMEDAHATRYTR